MKKFRLKMARQRGEQIAKDHGFESFPVDPFRIAADNEIFVEAKHPEKQGMSGCIIFTNDGVGIIYSTSIRSEGFQRFTVAHELGHYFLDDHPEEILKAGGAHVSKAGFTQGGVSIEIEADHFASGLLMPSYLVKKRLAKSRVGLPGIRALCRDAETSLTSAAIRAAECASFPMAVIISQGTNISYAFLSESFKRLGRLTHPRKGMPLPESATREFNADPSNIQFGRERCAPSSFSHWFSGDKKLPLDEEVIGLGSYGYTLTVLSSEAVDEDPYEEEDEEAKLLESWTPKFAYGR